MNAANYKILALFLLSFLFQKCSGNENIVDKKTRYGGTLKILINDPISTLDPVKILYASDLKTASIVFEGLVEFDSTGKIKPLLAEKWERKENGKRWLFYLKSNIYFQDDPCFKNGKGKKLSAWDVLYTFEHMANPLSDMVNPELFKNKILGYKEYYEGKTKHIKGIRVLDSNLVVFELTKPFVTFLKLLATPYAYIIPEEAVKFYGEDFGSHPVGTGPFRLAQWQKWKQLIFVKNRNYWDTTVTGYHLPFLNQINVNIAERVKLPTSELFKGGTHIILVDKLQFNELKKETNFLRKYGFTVMEKGTGLRYLSFSLNNGKPISNYKEIRKAITLSFNKEKIFAPGKFKDDIAYTLVPAHFFSKNIKLKQKLNLRKAKKILSTIPSQERNKEIKIYSTINSPAISALTKTLKNLNLNFSVKIKKMNYYKEIINRKPDIFRVSMVPSFPDPEEFYLLFYSKSGKNINLNGYVNSKYDSILKKSMFEQNPIKRDSLFLELEKILSEDLPAVYLTHEGTKYYVYSKNIKGLKLKYNVPSYKKVWIETTDDR